jgi:hypothetical protein
MMPDEFEALKMWAAEEGEVRPELDLPTLAGTSKDLNFKRSRGNTIMLLYFVS